jgi:hypothetical protein
MKIELLPPLSQIIINQPFGVNYLNFYKDMGLIGHPGIDFKASNVPCYNAIPSGGEVSWAGVGSDGGLCVMVAASMKGDSYGILYYHLKSYMVKTGDKLKPLEQIGITDNTGRYTTGNHLHFELYMLRNGEIINRNNGFNGRVNPAPYFPKGYDKSRAYHRYGKKANVLAEISMRFAPKNLCNRWTSAGHYIQSIAKRSYITLPISGEMTNMLVYGGWDIDSVLNPSMYQTCAWYTKEEYKKIFNAK